MTINPLLFPLVKLVHRLIKRSDTWCFLIEPNKPWGGNLRAMCEAAAADPRIQCIFLLNAGATSESEIRKRLTDPHGKVQIINQRPSLRNYSKIFRASHVFLEEYKDFGLPNIKVNLWHGIPIKNIGVFHVRTTRKHGKLRKRSFSGKQLNRHDYLVSSSRHDRVVMSACFHMSPEKVLNSGLPRNDWLNLDLPLPADLAVDLERIETLKAGRRLVLYTPTFRDESKGIIPLDEASIRRVCEYLSSINAVLGMRLHPASEGKVEGLAPSLGFLDCNSLALPEVQILLRATDVLVTDYSSTCLDFCITGKPSISYCPDLDSYSRGFLYPLESVFPGPLVDNLDDLEISLGRALNESGAYEERVYASRMLFHEGGRNNISQMLIDQLFAA